MKGPVNRGNVWLRAIMGEVAWNAVTGRILGVVGESGSGKSGTARSIMRMLRSPGRVQGGDIVLEGADLLELGDADMRAIRGKDVAMIFQDPQAALNPVIRIGDQIAEALEMHGVSRSAARERAADSWSRSVFRMSAGPLTSIHTNSRVECGSAWSSRLRSQTSRAC